MEMARATTMTTGKRKSSGSSSNSSNRSNGRARGGGSPDSENIHHGEGHPCEAVAEGVLLRLSPGRRKCC